MSQQTDITSKIKKTPAERAIELKAARTKLDARIAKLEARSADSKRRQDTQAKVYIGGMQLADCRADKQAAATLLARLGRSSPNARESAALAPVIAELKQIVSQAPPSPSHTS